MGAKTTYTCDRCECQTTPKNRIEWPYRYRRECAEQTSGECVHTYPTYLCDRCAFLILECLIDDEIPIPTRDRNLEALLGAITECARAIADALREKP